jgi:hypothetical protein
VAQGEGFNAVHLRLRVSNLCLPFFFLFKLQLAHVIFIPTPSDVNWEIFINSVIHIIKNGEVIGVAKGELKRIRIPVAEDTDAVDLMTREQIEEELSETYEWTGREYLLRLVDSVNEFSKKFKGRILGFIVESDDSGDIVRVTAIAFREKSRTLSLIDVEEWLKSRRR